MLKLLTYFLQLNFDVNSSCHLSLEAGNIGLEYSSHIQFSVVRSSTKSHQQQFHRLVIWILIITGSIGLTLLDRSVAVGEEKVEIPAQSSVSNTLTVAKTNTPETANLADVKLVPLVAKDISLAEAITWWNSVTVEPVKAPQPIQFTPGFLIAPRQLDLRSVNPAITQLNINDIPTNHRSRSDISTGSDSGDRRNTDFGLNTTGLYSPSVTESVSNDRVYRIEYQNGYTQVRSIRQQRNISTTIVTPQTANGQRQQISFVGDCLPSLGANPTQPKPGQICSYIPGFITDRNSIDPNTLVPTRFTQPSQLGDIVTPETLAAIKAPGFQAGANGQELGIDLYFPKIGTEIGNSQSSTTNADRFESSNSVPMTSTGRFKQVIVSNGRDIAIARTIRGFNYISGDPSNGLISTLQAASEVLPDAEVSLSPGKKGGSVAIDPTLILAANNNRIPDNSFTSYYVGVGRGKTPQGNQNSSANYQGVWMGFSPVIDRRISSNSTIQITGFQNITTFAGGEGGVDSSTSISAALNQNSFTSGAISNAYVQAYLTRYSQDINGITQTNLRETTNYHPHLSATGNVTTADSIFRYYSGVIFNPNTTSSSSTTNKVYGGLDFTKVENNGFSYNIAAIGYLNPDPEYYSRISTGFSQDIKLGRNPGYSLSLSSNFNYAFDSNSVFDSFNFRSGSSYVNVGAKANLGSVGLGVTYYIPNNMPNPINKLIALNGSWQVRDGIVLAGYYTPENENVTRSPYGVSANFRIGNDASSPTFVLSWSRNETDFGNNPDNSKVSNNDNVYAVYVRFGESQNFRRNP